MSDQSEDIKLFLVDTLPMTKAWLSYKNYINNRWPQHYKVVIDEIKQYFHPMADLNSSGWDDFLWR